MHADWIQSIERQLAEVPLGCLLESPRLSGAQAPPPRAPLGRPWTGGNLFPVSRPHPLPSVFPKRDLFSPACRPGLRPEITHCRRGRVGWEMKGGLTLYLGPGDLSLHPMDCCAHSTLRFPLGYYEGLLHLPEPGHLSQALPPALALGGVSPGNSAAVLSPGPPHVSPRADRAGPYFLSALRSAGGPPPALLHVESAGAAPLSLPAGPRRGTGLNQYLSQQVEIIRAIHDQLMAHPNQRTTIEALAKEYHLNTSTLKAVFKAVYGQPIASHMKHHRMQKAARLLRETDLSIGDIAQQVGYENQSKFSNVFRDIFQVLPLSTGGSNP